jgi:hypothetical protein
MKNLFLVLPALLALAVSTLAQADGCLDVVNSMGNVLNSYQSMINVCGQYPAGNPMYVQAQEAARRLEAAYQNSASVCSQICTDPQVLSYCATTTISGACL